jgi:hypothetical protein
VSARVGELTLAGSGTPLEKEYRAVCEAMNRGVALPATFDRGGYDPRAVASCLAMWELRMDAEHRSTAVFSALTAQLMEANATLDAKVVMLRMAQDELRHTETCGRVIEALGGTARRTIELEVAPLAVHRGCSPEERALRNVIYTTCMSEMVAVARFVETLDQTTDPYMREATRMLLADEVLHGQYGFHYLAAWQPWLDAHGEVRASLHRYLRHAFAVLEGALGGRLPEGVPRPTDDERALGVGDPEAALEVFYNTIEHAVAPGLDRFGLDATTAWRNRRVETAAPVAPTAG